MSKQLFKFNTGYYQYPTSINRGYWGCYLIEKGLSEKELLRRNDWLKSIEEDNLNLLLKQYLGDSFKDLKVNNSLLKLHGIFVGKFYTSSIKNEVVKRISSNEKTLNDITNIVKNDKTYSHLAKNKHDVMSVVVSYITEQQLYEVINNKSQTTILNDWYDMYSITRDCVICGNKYRIIDIPDWLYFSSNGNKISCLQCEIIQKPLKKELFKIIPNFVNTCGFIPKTNSHPLEYSFSSRFNEQEWVNLTKLFGEMGGIEHVKKKFGSWFKALVETKAVPNGVKITSRGLWCVANDGHECHSIDEQTIDNWLHSNNIEHSREPSYPKNEKLNNSGRRRADWMVGEVFIEYFGLIGDKGYEKKMNEKIMLASVSNIPLIEIYPSDLKDLNKKLGVLIERRKD